MDRRLVELGPHCGKRGPYSFYKSFKYTDNGVWRTVATDQFFFVNISVSTPLCIGEMQLLWTVRNNVSDPLSSLRLYFLPEQLPDGRQHYHGENEVIATEKIVIRLSDLVTWLVSPTNESEWPVGLPWPLAQQPRSASSTANSKAAVEGALLSTSPVVVVSYAKYCRLMAVLRRLESSPLAASTSSLLLGLGGSEPACKHAMVAAADGLPAGALLLRSAVADTMPCESSFTAAFTAAAVGIVCGLPCTLSPNAKLVFCRSTCEHPEVEDHEFRCDYLAPNLKGRSRKRRVAAKQTESSESEENDASPVADCAVGSPRVAASAVAADSVSQETVTHASKSRPPRKSNGTVRTKDSSALPLARKREGTTSAEQEEEDSFLKSVYSFMKERGTPIHRLPCLGFKQIDLYELYKGAEKLGGYNQICQKRRWKLLYDQIGGNPTNTSAATCTRKHYERLLLPFEQHLKGQPSGSDRLAILDRQSSSPSSSSSAGPPDAAEAVTPIDAEATVAEADDSKRSSAVVCNDASAHPAASAAEAVINGPAESCGQPVTNWSSTNWRVGTSAAPSSAASTGDCGLTSSEPLPAVANRHGSSSARRRSPSSSDDRCVNVAADDRKPRLPPPPALVPQHFGPPGGKLETSPLPEAARHHHHRNNIVDAQGTHMQDKFADGAATGKWSYGRSSRSPSRESSFRPATAASRSTAVVTSATHVGTASQCLSSAASGSGSDHRQFYRPSPAAAVWPHSSVTAGSSAPSSISVVSGPLPVSASSSSSRAAVTATTWRVPTNEAPVVACSDPLSAAHPLPASLDRERGIPPGACPAPGTVPLYRPLAVAGSGGARVPRNDSPGGSSGGTSCRIATGAVQPPPAHRYHSHQRDAGPGMTLPSTGNSVPTRPPAVATARSAAVAHLGSQSLVAALQPRLGTAFETAASADVTATAHSKQQPVPAAHARSLAAVKALEQLVYGFVPEELVRLQGLRFPVVVCPYRYDCRTVYGDPCSAVALIATVANGACSAAAGGGSSTKRKHDSAAAATSAVASGSLQAPLLLHRGGGGTPVHDLTCKRPRLPGGSSSCWTPDIRSGWSPNGIVSGLAGDGSSHGTVSRAPQQHQQYHHRSLSAPQPSRKLLHSSVPSTEAESQLTVAAGLLRPAATATGHHPVGRAAGRSMEAGLSSLPPPTPRLAAGEMAAGVTAATSYARPPVPRAHTTPSLLAMAPPLLLQQPQQQPWTVPDLSPSVAAVRPAFAGVDSRSGRRATAVVDGSTVIEERAAAALRSTSAVDRLGRAAAAVTAPFQDPYAVPLAAHSSSQQLRTSYELVAGTGQACGVPSAAAGRHLRPPSPLIHRCDPSPSGATRSRTPSTAGRSLAPTGAASLPTSLVSCREAADADGVAVDGRGSSGGSNSSSGGKGGEAMYSSSSTADSRLAGRHYL